MTIPGIGVICATAMEALAPPPESFRKGRDFAAWLGLTPKQNSSGGKTRLGGTSKMGQRDLRRLLVSGAITQVRWAMRKGAPEGSWLARMRGKSHAWSSRWRLRTAPRGSRGPRWPREVFIRLRARPALKRRTELKTSEM